MTVAIAAMAPARKPVSRTSKADRLAWRGQVISWLQVAPATLVLLIFFVVPFLVIAAVSFFDYTRTELIPAIIFFNYEDVFNSAMTLRLYGASLKFFAIVWAITLLIGFNLAYFAVFHVRSNIIRVVLLLLCAIPFWTSGIIRMVAWIPFLGRNGLLNSGLMALGLPQGLDFLLYSDVSVIIVYVNLFTAIMMGPIANSMLRIDRSLIEAAIDAGASRWQVMRYVVIPLSKSGIMLGTILIFVAVMGDAGILATMSGQQGASVVSALATEIGSLQYPPAAASAVVLVVFVGVCVSLAMKVVNLRAELK